MELVDLGYSGEPDTIDEEIRLRDEGKSHTFSFCMWPRMWRSYRSLTELDWQSFHLTPDDAEVVPDQPGVYAFLIKPSMEGVLGASYLVYVGQTSRTLRQRFKEYLREKNARFGRKKIVEFLKKYDNHIHFSCAIVNGSIDPEQVESELLKAYMPPANSDFPAEVKRIVPYQSF